jgi:hypothetical protein
MRRMSKIKERGRNVGIDTEASIKPETVTRPAAAAKTEIKVIFLGENGKPEVGNLDIAGLRLTKGGAVTISPEQLAALRAHPQYSQFEFAFMGDEVVIL